MLNHHQGRRSKTLCYARFTSLQLASSHYSKQEFLNQETEILLLGQDTLGAMVQCMTSSVVSSKVPPCSIINSLMISKNFCKRRQKLLFLLCVVRGGKTLAHP